MSKDDVVIPRKLLRDMISELHSYSLMIDWWQADERCDLKERFDTLLSDIAEAQEILEKG